MRFITHRLLLTFVGLVFLAAAAAMVLLYSGGIEGSAEDQALRDEAQRRSDILGAQILEVLPLPDDDTTGLPPGAVSVEVTVRLDETGEVITFPMIDDTGDTFRAGQDVAITAHGEAGEDTLYVITDFQRDRPLALLAMLFVLAVVAFGRFQGFRALIGLVLTGFVIVLFLVPTILNGQDPVVAALASSAVIMVITLYLSHGASRKTTAAVVGTAFALMLTGALAVLFVQGANLTGFTSEEAQLANFQASGGLSLRGLLLAGIILGGLGVLDDVTMSQASTVFELRRANPRARFTELMGGALTVGRDHVAATVNTLFLAYAGAALPLLILFAVGIDPVLTVLTSEIVAVEVVRTLVGSLGLIAAVPITTALAAALACSEPEEVAAEAQYEWGHHGHAPAPAAVASMGREEWGLRPATVASAPGPALEHTASLPPLGGFDQPARPGYPVGFGSAEAVPQERPEPPAYPGPATYPAPPDWSSRSAPPAPPPMPYQPSARRERPPAAERPVRPQQAPPPGGSAQQRGRNRDQGQRSRRDRDARAQRGRSRALPSPTSPQEAEDLEWIRQLRDAYGTGDLRRQGGTPPPSPRSRRRQ